MMVLNIHVPGATPYEIGDEIWKESLATPSVPKQRSSPPTRARTCSNRPTKHTGTHCETGSPSR